MKTYSSIVLLVDDQPLIAEAVRHMLESQPDIIFHYCKDPSKALEMAIEVRPTVILQDLAMPDIDGLMLVRYFRANISTRDVPLIVLSATEDPKVKAEAFALGANDYMVKLPDRVELVARIRYHSAAYIRLLERNEAYEKLQESQKALNTDLRDAAQYVSSLLPPPLTNNIKTSWRYIPSALLGGDAFGYHWVDDEHFVFYLLDVCGHGVRAALLSITIMNVLYAQTLPSTNFKDPKAVLKALNTAFPMENHYNMFFTIWYGVFNKSTREIVYSTGGHPPALLFSGKTPTNIELTVLKTPGLVIGAIPEVEFENQICQIPKFNQLFLFSDGVYEIIKPDGLVLQLDEFTYHLEEIVRKGADDLDSIYKYVKTLNGEKTFQDDFSILKIIFD